MAEAARRGYSTRARDGKGRGQTGLHGGALLVEMKVESGWGKANGWSQVWGR